MKRKIGEPFTVDGVEYVMVYAVVSSSGLESYFKRSRSAKSYVNANEGYIFLGKKRVTKKSAWYIS